MNVFFFKNCWDSFGWSKLDSTGISNKSFQDEEFSASLKVAFLHCTSGVLFVWNLIEEFENNKKNYKQRTYTFKCYYYFTVFEMILWALIWINILIFILNNHNNFFFQKGKLVYNIELLIKFIKINNLLLIC